MLFVEAYAVHFSNVRSASLNTHFGHFHYSSKDEITHLLHVNMELPYRET
jgi:uncharacterized protein YlbG (UPF0298 family)